MMKPEGEKIRKWGEVGGLDEKISPSDQTPAEAKEGPMRAYGQDNYLKSAEEQTEDDYNSIDGIMNNGVRNRCAYLRKMAIDGYYICVELSDVKEMVRLLRIYGNNLNQIARRANEGDSIYRNDIEDLQKNMQELWKMMRQILEKLSCLE